MFKIVHHFVGNEGILREIKWLNKPENTPENEVYQWQWIPFGYEPINLKLLSKQSNSRRFEEGSVILDHLQCSFQYYDQNFKLRRSK